MVRALSLVFVVLFVSLLSGCGGGGTTTTLAPPDADLTPIPIVEAIRFQGNWVPVVGDKIHVGDIVNFRPVTTSKGGSGVITNIDVVFPDGTHTWGPPSRGGFLVGMAGNVRYTITFEGTSKPIIVNLVAVMPLGIVLKYSWTDNPLIIHDNGNYLCDKGTKIQLTVDGKAIEPGKKFVIKLPDGTETTTSSEFIPSQVGWHEISCGWSSMPPEVRLEVRATGIDGFG